MNCWEFKKCGREKGGEKAVELGICPAYPDNGKNCAVMVGTLCGGKLQGSFALKLGNCMRCEFYNSPHYRRKGEGSTILPDAINPLPAIVDKLASSNLDSFHASRLPSLIIRLSESPKAGADLNSKLSALAPDRQAAYSLVLEIIRLDKNAVIRAIANEVARQTKG